MWKVRDTTTALSTHSATVCSYCVCQHVWAVAPRLLCPWDSPGKSTGVGCHFLLHGIFLTQGSNLHLLH